MNRAINRQWRLAAHPIGMARKSDLEWREEPIPAPGDGQVLVRNVYLSLDPTNRVWMNEADSYMPSVRIGEVMRGLTLSVVEQSRYPKLTRGDLVMGLLGWQDFAVADGSSLSSLEKIQPLTAYLGLFNPIIGLTAYVGVLDIAKPKAGETMVVSGAAGAVGSVAGQIGKIKGCRVVGIAGSAEKCRWLTEMLGFDAAINYKAENVLERLETHCPKGVDIVWENVGGDVFNAELALLNLNARIVLCGMISQYNATAPVSGPANLINVLLKRAQIKGFICIDHMDRANAAMTDLGQWLAEGQIKYRVEVVNGLENAAEAVNKLFDGSNQGKLMVRVSEEP
jgi:NADPH-dependent curcumin reductase CurA